MPPFFAYEIRSPGGRVIGFEFALSYIIAQGVRYVALIGYNDCGMTKVPESIGVLTDALTERGWPRDRAEEYVSQQAPCHSFAVEIDALQREYLRMRRLFGRLEIAPLFVSLANSELYLPKWYLELQEVGPSGRIREEDLLML